MNTTVLLENFRQNNMGGSFFVVNEPPFQKVYMPYEQHSTAAFYFSMNDLAALEHSTTFVHTGNQTHSAISFWYLALESYVNTLIKLCCIKKNIEFKAFKNQDLHGRLSSLVQLLELDIKLFNQNRLITKVNEFCFFRNELFHDRYFGNEISFHHTNFSSVPILNCQVDVIQSLLIVLEVSSALRYSIQGLDTMPSVIIRNHEFCIWEKLDVAYKKIIEPYFNFVLRKHNLQTEISFIFDAQEHFCSKTFAEGDIGCFVVADQEAKFEYHLNNTVTEMGLELYNNYLQSLNYTPGKFILNKVTL